MTGPLVPAVAVRRPPDRGLPSPLARLSSWLQRTYVDPETPAVAVEFRAASVGVVRVRRDHGKTALVSAAALDLPAGALVPSLLQPNVVDAERVRATLHGALERCGVLGGARVAVVLPDPAARVSLVSDAALAGKRGPEVEELLRFRLRKSLPFDVREAQVAWAVPAAGSAGPALVVSALRSVLEGYEAVCRSAGLDPGLVEVAALALARSAFPPGTTGDRLLVNWDDAQATVVVARGDWPVLVRTLSGVAASPAELSRELANTVVYYRERLAGDGIGAAVVRATTLPAAEAAGVVHGAIGVLPDVLDPLAALGGATAIAGGPALAGAAAALEAA